jgi:hydroxymethylglutaryl-CoA reductase (NADPH)
MIASSFLPSRFRGEQPASQAAAPSWLNKKITPFLQVLSRITSSHPIHTVVIVALLASSSYIGLLEDSLFDATRGVRRAEWSSLVERSRRLRTGPDTAWKWQTYDTEASIPRNVDHLALLTLVFPETMSTDTSRAPPVVTTVPIPENISITSLPSTSNSFTTYSQDSALAFSVPYSQAPDFLAIAQEIPNDISSQETRETEHGREKKMWIMKAVRVQTRSSLVRWAQNAWVEFLDLLKNAETLDIVIMILGYISMHLTFVSLSLSMRHMGSNFWLAASVLFSSVFAFLFGLFVTAKLGVPLTMVLLSEGLPFLVVTIGFEKNIVLTRAVLSHAIEHRRSSDKDAGKSSKKLEGSSSLI